MQVALNGFTSSFLLVWLYGRIRTLGPTAGREAGLVPFALFLGLVHWMGASQVLWDRGILAASAVVVAWGAALEVFGKGSSKYMLVGDVLGAATLVWLGLEVPFLTSPNGGYIYLHSGALPLTCFWLVSFIGLLKLANRLPGLFTGVMALLSYLIVGSMLYQQQHTVVDYRIAALLSGVSTGMWLNGMGGRTQRMGRTAASLWALLLGALTVLSTSKKVATLAVLSPVGLGLAPLFFFTFVILRSYLWPRITRPSDRQEILRVSLSKERLVGVLLLFCLLIDLLLLLWLFVPSKLRSLGIAFVMAVIYFEVIQLVLLRSRSTDTVLPETVDLLGIKIRRASPAQHLETARKWLYEKKDRWIVTPDSLAILRAQEDEEYRHVMTRADMVLPDSAGVLWATDFLYEQPVLEQIPGVQFVQALCALAAEEKAPVFLLGTRQVVLDAAKIKLEETYPGLKIVGTQDGFFADHESEAVAAKIAESGAKICFVAMGVPKQEKWIQRFGAQTGACILMGVGGSLDVLSGSLERAPQIFQSLGLEWLYRTALEPKRLKRISHLPRFVLKILETKLKQS